MWLGLAVALAGTPEGYDFVRDSDGCHITMRPEDHPEGPAMRAECAWPEVDPQVLGRMMGQFDRYSEYIWPIDLARVERKEAKRTLVYQRQRIFGLSDREVLLWIEEEPLDDGVRFSWVTASEQPLELAEGAIRTPKNIGSWTLRTGEEGGASVVHQIAVDAGGSVPKWVIRLVRARGFARVMSEMRALAAEESQAP